MYLNCIATHLLLDLSSKLFIEQSILQPSQALLVSVIQTLVLKKKT